MTAFFKHPLSSLFTSLLFLSISHGLQNQTLSPRPLPAPPPQLIPELPWMVSDAQASPDAALTLRLEPIDSLPPSFNSTPERLFHLRLRRDARRVKHLSAHTSRRRGFSAPVVSGLPLGEGEYITRLGIGTPSLNNYLVLDTGSDLTWVQCRRCKSCYSQVDPIFDPEHSRTFRHLLCSSPLCRSLTRPGCDYPSRTCLYQVRYGDGSFTVGDLATETLSFDGANRIPGVPLGCGHDNRGLFVASAGILGLGRGPLSFPSFTGRLYGGRFSYCLVERTAASKSSALQFGGPAPPPATRFTPLLTDPLHPSFYFVGLTGFSVGGEMVRAFHGNGGAGVILDSGTSVTRLSIRAYAALRDAFRLGAADIGGREVAGGVSLFDTCYDLAGMERVAVPTVAMWFGDVEVALPARNYLIPVDGRGTHCFAFAPTDQSVSIIGNIQQQGVRVVYDLAGSRVGFEPGACD